MQKMWGRGGAGAASELGRRIGAPAGRTGQDVLRVWQDWGVRNREGRQSGNLLGRRGPHSELESHSQMFVLMVTGSTERLVMGAGCPKSRQQVRCPSCRAVG